MSADHEIAALARRQHGFVTRRQLRGLGLTDHTIDQRLKTGRLIAVHHGVCAVGHVPPGLADRAVGVVLACGPGATLSHGSAASLWGVTKRWSQPFEVSVPGVRRPTGVKLHCRVALTPRDRRHHHGVWVTSPARTILDIASTLTDKQCKRAVDGLRVAGWLSPGALADTLIRFPRHPGAARIRAIVADPRGPTRSELEIAFLSLVEVYGLPKPAVNVMCNGYEVDALFRAERVIVELDGFQTHGSRAAFETDRERDAVHIDNGYLTIRVTYERMTKAPEREARRLHRILESRRA